MPMSLRNSSFLKGFSDAYLADLGRIVLGWSHVEMSFDMLYLLFVVMRGASSGSLHEPRVTNLMGAPFDRKISNFRDRLAELNLDFALRDDIYRTLDQLLTLRRERDRVAHSVFSITFDEAMEIPVDRAAALYKSWKNTKEHEHTIVKQERLREIFDRIHALYWKLHEITLNQELRNANIVSI